MRKLFPLVAVFLMTVGITIVRLQFGNPISQRVPEALRLRGSRKEKPHARRHSNRSDKEEQWADLFWHGCGVSHQFDVG
jgi:hypothetical protein